MTFVRKYNVTLDLTTAGSLRIRIPIRKAGSADFATNSDWTPAAGDVKVSKDGGAAANIGTLPSYSNGQWEFILSNTELSARQVTVQIVDSATKAVDDDFFVVETFGHASAMFAGDYIDAVRQGMTSLPNAAAGANTGLPVVGTQVPNATAGASGGLIINGANSGTVTFAAFTVTGKFTVTGGAVYGNTGLDDYGFQVVNNSGTWAAFHVHNRENTGQAIATQYQSGNGVGGTGFLCTGLHGLYLQGAGGGASLALDGGGGQGILASGNSTLGTVTMDVAGKILGTGAGVISGIGVWSAGASGGTLALSSDILNISNNTRVRSTIPMWIERPDSGNESLEMVIECYDSNGNMEGPDSTPTLALVDRLGNDLSSRLSALSNPSTGRFTFTYTNSSADGLTWLRWTVSVVEGGATRTYSFGTTIVDTTAVDFTAADRTKLDALHGKLPSKSFLTGTNNSDGDIQINEATGTPADSAGVTTLLTNLAALAAKFTGITSAANWWRAGLRKSNTDATATNEINADVGAGAGTFSPPSDSNEAIRDRGDAAWGGGGGGGTPKHIKVTVKNKKVSS